MQTISVSQKPAGNSTSLAQHFTVGNRNTIKEGRSGLYGKESVAHNFPRKTSPEVIEKILEIRTDHQLGALRITYYLDRYHGIRVLRAHGICRLPKTAPRRALHTKRYAKEVPGHHVQLDVKFLRLKDIEG